MTTINIELVHSTASGKLVSSSVLLYRNRHYILYVILSILGRVSIDSDETMSSAGAGGQSNPTEDDTQ